MNKQKLIAQLIDQLNSLPHRNKNKLDALLRKSEMIIRNSFGKSSKYLSDLKEISFFCRTPTGLEELDNKCWNSGVNKLKNLFQTMSEQIALFGSTNETLLTKENKKYKIFLVHGHNNEVKNEVARFLEKLKIEATILHEKPNIGKTIIEKFESESSDIDFAVVLLTGDDMGSSINTNEESKPRARQNVIFELGYFIGKLGRSKVVALREENVEIPSDYSGIIYIELTRDWKLHLAREIKASGINIDLNLAV